MGIGTFGSFTQARLAIYAAQTGLTVTGNNISNINTEGYTRQRLDQTSLYTAGSDRYYSRGDVRVGQGVLVRSLSQIRSPYLDIQYREQSAKVGFNDTMLDGLNRVASILDEVGKGDPDKEEDGFGILGQEFNKIMDALSELTDQTGHQEYDSTVKAACNSLARKLNSYAASLQSTYDEVVDELHGNIETVNGYLTSIRELNEEIRKCDIRGNPALELRDERNLQIDKLSQLIGIRVQYSMEEFSYGVEVEKLSIYLDNANPDGAIETDSSLLIDGIFGAQLILEQAPERRALNQNDTTTWPYEDAAGNPVRTADEAAKMRTLNPDRNAGAPNSAANPWYLDKKGNPTSVEEDSPIIPVPNRNAMLYLKADGSPTADPAEARMVDSPNFNITVSELRNKAGRLLYTISEQPEKQVDGTDAAAVQEAQDAVKQGGTIIVPGEGKNDLIVKNYRMELRANPDYKPYLDGNGNPTSQWTTSPNPAYYKYVKTEDGHRVFSNNMSPGMQENPAYTGPYLDAQGNVTANADDAQRLYYVTEYYQTASKPVELDDNDLTGSIQAQRELLTEGAEFTDRDIISKAAGEGVYRNTDENAGTKRGIVYFQRRLDLLANQLAQSFNEANQGFYTDPDGNYITSGTNPETGKEIGVPISFNYTDGTETKTFYLNKETKWEDIPAEVRQQMQANNPNVDSVESYLKEGGAPDADGNPTSVGFFDGGVLFSNNGSGNNTEGITAANISVSYQWQNTENLLVRSFTCAPQDLEPASGDPENILHFQYILDGDSHDFIPGDLDVTGATTNASKDIMFSGTFYAFWNGMGDLLGQDQTHMSTMLDTAYENALAIDTNRDSVSSVDFNDEAMNLMMYAKSYNAACRLMTTIDSVLEKLINNTGITT